ncbi:MAG TPA: hypothetical protein VKU00_14010 [Chthonomonadaceae bacterium]|nr:hypothetical protein [Chthonomonadaceae bacterium]
MPTHIRTHSLIPALIALLLLPASFVLGKDRAQGQGGGAPPSETSHIDWEKGRLTATGLGVISKKEPDEARAYLVAYNTAKMDALRNLLMLSDQVQIDSHSLGADFEAKEDTIRAEMQGRLRGAKVVSQRVLTVGNGRLLEVTVATTLPEEERSEGVFHPKPPAEPQDAEPAPRRFAAPTFHKPQVHFPSRDTAPSDNGYRIAETPSPCPPKRSIPQRPVVRETYTSVIIDARGLHLERSMSPRICRADGSPVWGNVDVDPDWLIEHGIVAYAHSIQEARSNPRAGENPLILRAVGREGGNYASDPILRNMDATALLQANDMGGFLEKYRVIFVLDAEK